MQHFAPVSAFFGELLISLDAVVLMLFPSRIAGIAAIVGGLLNGALTGKEAMIGQIATVVDGFAPAVGLRAVCGKVRLNGEFWSAESMPRA